MTRSGFVALAGRPNVGKSTLVNALVGEKVAIVSDRPQTTRRAIRGVRSAGDCQMVLVDLPGVQRPRDALTERMAQRVRQELEGCDAALMVLNGEQGVGPGDRFIAQARAELAARHDPLTGLPNRTAFDAAIAEAFGRRRRQARQHVPQIRPRLNAQSMTCGGEAHQHRGCVPALLRAHEQPVLAANGNPFRLTFRHVVVNVQEARLRIPH